MFLFADYVKVFSAYLGEIPMTADIKRMEQNLPSDKKKKIYYLKKCKCRNLNEFY